MERSFMLSIEEKIGQKCMVGFHGTEPPDYILEWLSSARIGGVILFSRNIHTPEQVAKLTSACHAAARHPILIGIDQEDGTVARLHEGFTQSPGAMALGAAGSEALAYQMSHVLGRELRALGINWNYAPVVDITHDINNPSVGRRSLGSDEAAVSRLAAAEVRGFQDSGVVSSAKHFPGLGNTPDDTHEALAVISGSVDYLWEHDLIPFRAVVKAGVATVMTTHVKFEALDSEYPATLSPEIVTKLLREESVSWA
jgi:beta-N-acetylhexosaminidase